MTLNRSILIGRLTRDPDLKYTPAGVAVCTFTLAVDRPFTNGGEKEADFIPVVVWRQLAETAANHLKKGRLTAVEGRIQVRNYTNNDGKKVFITEVIADNVRFLDKQEQQQSSPPPTNHNNRDPFAGDGQPIDISEDDLPF